MSGSYTVTTALDGPNVNVFDVIYTTLETNHTHQIREIDRLVDYES